MIGEQIISSGHTIKSYFSFIDINNDGLISRSEMKSALSKMMPTIKEEEIIEI